MPEIFMDTLDKAIVKSMDFSQFLTTFIEDLKIEKSLKPVRTVIFHGLVVYNPVFDAGHAHLRRKNS